MFKLLITYKGYDIELNYLDFYMTNLRHGKYPRTCIRYLNYIILIIVFGQFL